MNTSSQTIKFVVVAAVMAGLAGLTSIATRPTPIDEFAKVGEPFFGDFKDPNLATAVRVVAYNEDTASARVFTVENKDGVWRIPSHHNYPADGKDRLARTAQTLIGVKRGAVASRVAADHERFGVVNPLDDGTDTLKGRGQRLTLLKDSDIAVADLIIGKKLPEGENRYYVRHPEEKETYITELEVDISTKFGDWVEADLLKLDRDDLTRLQARSTKIEGRDFSEVVDASLSRTKASDDWALEGLDEETEEVNKEDITAMVNVIDNLKLSGVRRRPELAGKPILRGDLSIALPKSAAQNPQIVNQVIDMVQSSLNSKGFLVYENREANDFRLYAKAGEMVAATKDGVQFHMSFGNEFEGSDDEIEIGGTTAETEDTSSAEEQKPADPPGSKDAEDEEDGGGKDNKKTKSRYLIVRTSFDEDLLGPKLVLPVKPNVPDGIEVDADGNVVKPAEKEAEKPVEPKADEEDASAKKAADAEQPAEAGTDKPADADTRSEDAKANDAGTDKTADNEAKPAEATETEEKVATPNLADIYQRAIEKFRADQKKYDADVKVLEQKIVDGKKKVDELNERFADWFYVITEEDFGKLRLNRDQLVKPKVKEEPKDGDAKSGDAAPAGAVDKTDAPILNPPPGDAKPAVPVDAEKTPATDAAKPAAAKPADATPADPKPAAAEKAPEASTPAAPATESDANKPVPADKKPVKTEDASVPKAVSTAVPAKDGSN